MSKDVLQIGIPCGKNSELFVEFLISTIERTISGKFDVELILGINQPGTDISFLQNLKTNLKKKVIVSEDLISGFGGGVGHGQCLDMIFEKMNSRYGMVLDCDTALLYKGWDEKLISLLGGKTIIIGSEYGKDQQKFMKNPNAIMCVFLVNKLKETGLSWKPRSSYIEISEENCEIYGRSVGDKIFLDTSCDIPVCLKKSGFSGIPIPLVSPRIDKNKIRFMTENMRGEEYQLDGIPIVTHLGRGQVRNLKSSPEAVLWLNRVEEWLTNL